MKLTAETTLKSIAIVMGAGAALMAMLELQRALEEDTAAQPAPVVAEDPLKRELRRCRTLTPEALEADTDCQDAWAENRRRFFGLSSDSNQGTE
jgi:conjugative transfer region protein TrbK